MIYVIKKSFIKDNRKQHVFLTDGHSEVLEVSEDEANKLVDVLNENSDSGCVYEALSITKRK